jgi:hypothetical protein
MEPQSSEDDVNETIFTLKIKGKNANRYKSLGVGVRKSLFQAILMTVMNFSKTRI